MPSVDTTTFMQAMQEWQSGQQEAAKATIQPSADDGDPRAQALMAWFLHQQQPEGWRQAVSYAQSAVAAGYPQTAGYVIGNMMNDPALLDQGVELARQAAAQGVVTIDPLNQAIAFAQQGNEAGVTQMLAVPWPVPGPGGPITPEYWTALITKAQQSMSNLSAFVEAGSRHRANIEETAEAVKSDAESVRQRIEERSTTLLEFMDQTTNAEASKYFDDEAQTSKTEADAMWKWGVRVIATAAGISILPLVAHYLEVLFGVGPRFSNAQVVSIHITGALALGTMAGVMLARARVRDRNRQRNTDLRVALQMMFAYAQQIENPSERQQFIQSNGRVVLEAFLRQDSAPASDESRNLLSALSR